MRTICEVHGVIEAPADRVSALLLAVRPGQVGPDNCWLLTSHGGVLTGGPERFTLTTPSHSMTVEVGPSWLAAQGGWWYRGEYHIKPHPNGTELVHRVLNAAEWMRWGVPLANRFFVGFEATTRQGFASLLDRVTAELTSGPASGGSAR
ncbi:hypothetical protein Acor_64910 [Acrocarpospora corrugata]|uniref:Polyketide cyclase n=1 Tax=Acrocarpospora corrugata TaxID=35763 RepID=A0A5M3WB87_9ACTN|nr:hypothetical protein [Acrocarpospora corrugata]GES04423.1 hypothetical protein Acor_64910 [Acrocarpospora corrugata]